MLDEWVAGQMGLPGGVWDRPAAEKWKLDALRRTVAYARAKSPYYCGHLPETEIREFKDFEELPFTTPEDLKEHGMAMLCCTPDRVQRIITLSTSGTTGQPKRVCFTAYDLERTIEYFQHGIAEFVSPGMRVMILFPGRGENGLNDLLSRALVRLGAIPVVFGYPVPDVYPELFRKIEEEQIDFLVGAAVSIADAAGSSVRCGEDAKLADRIRGVLLSAEYVSDENKEAIASIWNCRVHEHYSMTETGLCGAVGCGTEARYHVWESGVYYEIIDPSSGKKLPDGSFGEIVVTTFGREAMPVIRYRTGDISRLLPSEETCRCGSRLQVLDRVASRPEEKKFLRRVFTGDLPE